MQFFNRLNKINIAPPPQPFPLFPCSKYIAHDTILHDL